MRSGRVLIPAIILVLMASLLIPRTGLADDDRKKTKLTGLVLAVNPAGGSFEMREFGENIRWLVILRKEAEVEGRAHSVSVGDIIELEGQILEARTILAKKVKVVAHTGALPAPSPAPVPVLPAPAAPPSVPGSGMVGAVIKTLGVGAAVKFFAPALNNFINGLLRARDAETKQVTKVVPILAISIGINTPGKATVGAAQVTGVQAAVDKVVAVAAVDANFQDGFFVRTLIPVDSLEPWKRLRRVVGVGVSAIIDIRL